MSRRAWSLPVGVILTIGAAFSPASAQNAAGLPSSGPVVTTTVRVPGYFEPPGYYGTSWGTASFGYAPNYTAFASPSGPGYGYGYGYAPFAEPAYPHGARLWKPGSTLPGYVYGAPFYNGYLVPYNPTIYNYPAPIGIYAPGFGPAPYGW
ncbi:MAG: hypothetical protein NVSMB14_07790 [Isosphaeraceae bacterium]